MKKGGSEQDQILKRVEQAFGRHRRRNGGRRSYSTQLKAFALSAMESGIAPSAIAEAAGISQQSLANWQIPSTKPRELLLMSDTPSTAATVPNVSPSQVARIRLCSGVSIEVPVSAVTPSLIAALTGGTR